MNVVPKEHANAVVLVTVVIIFGLEQLSVLSSFLSLYSER